MSEIQKLRVGIIGCGDIVFRKFIKPLQSLPFIEIVAFASRSLESANKVRSFYGNSDAVTTTDVNLVFDNPNIDIVCICVPNYLHAQYSIRALERGKHVFCEKPMALTFTDCQRMITAARQANKYLTVGFQNRFKAESQYVNFLKMQDHFGPIYHVEVSAIRRRGVPTWGTFLEQSIQGGGALIDIGSHAIDMALWLTDNYRPRYVCGQCYNCIARAGSKANRWGEWDPKTITVEDSAFAFLTMHNGMTMAIKTAWALNTTQEHEIGIKLYGAKVGLEMQKEISMTNELDRGFVTATISLPSNTTKRIFGNDTDIMSASDQQVFDFINAIMESRPPVVLPEQAAVVVQIIEGIYKSARTAHPVYFTEQ